MSQVIQVVRAQETKTVYCVAVKAVASGGVHWFLEESKRDQFPCSKPHVWFDLDVPATVSEASINYLTDLAASEEWYHDDRADCRLTGPLQLFNVTLDWEPGDDEQGDYATSVWAVDSDDAIRRVAEEMADSGEVTHDSDKERTEYIERVIEGAGQYAAELVKDKLVYDLDNFLHDRPDALKAIKAILAGAQVVEVSPSTVTLSVCDEATAIQRPSANVLGWLLDQARELKAMKVGINGKYSPGDLADWDARLADAERVRSHLSGSPDLSLLESNVLLGELRRRGLVVSAWSQDDATSTLENDDGTDSLTEEQFGQLEAVLFARASVSLEDLLTERGNRHIADVWDIHRTSLIAEVCGSLAESEPAEHVID